MDHETLIRKRVHALKTFYTNLFIYAAVCIVCIIIWLSMGGGAFWPIWVIFGCGLSAVLQGVSLGQLPQLHELFPFLSPSWEEEQVKNQLERTDQYHQPEVHSHAHLSEEAKNHISTETKKKTPQK